MFTFSSLTTQTLNTLRTYFNKMISKSPELENVQTEASFTKSQMQDQLSFTQTMRVYKGFTDSVAVYPAAGQNDVQELSYIALGLAGETGEAVDIVKKAVRRGHLMIPDQENLQAELGDILYYWVRLCYATGNRPEEVMNYNIQKLRQRKAAGTIKDRK